MRVAPKPSRPRDAEVAKQAVHFGCCSWIGSVPRLVVRQIRRMRMIDIVVHVGVVGVLRTVGHQGLGAGRDSKKLKAYVIPLRARFRDRPDRIFG